jgi:hypothetical protein
MLISPAPTRKLTGSGVGDGSGVGVSVGVDVGVGVGVNVSVGVGVAVEVLVGVGEGVGVRVALGVGVKVEVGVEVAVGEGVNVLTGVDVAHKEDMEIEDNRQGVISTRITDRIKAIMLFLITGVDGCGIIASLKTVLLHFTLFTVDIKEQSLPHAEYSQTGQLMPEE